jgi:hypothetical protein
VDEPTARRRRHARGADSVSVAELLARTTQDEQTTISPNQARAAAEADARAAGRPMPTPPSGIPTAGRSMPTPPSGMPATERPVPTPPSGTPPQQGPGPAAFHGRPHPRPGPHPTGPHPTGPHPTGPHATGPHTTGPYPTGPHPTGPHVTGPHRHGPAAPGAFLGGHGAPGQTGGQGVGGQGQGQGPHGRPGRGQIPRPQAPSRFGPPPGWPDEPVTAVEAVTPIPPAHTGHLGQFEQAVHAGQLGRQQPPPAGPHQGHDDYPEDDYPEDEDRAEDRAEDDRRGDADDHGYDPLADDGDGPRSSSRLTKTIVVTVLAILVTGAVTAGATIRGDAPRRLTPSVPVVQPVAMDGPDVVRLSVVIDTLSLGSPEVNPSTLPEPAPTTGPTPDTGEQPETNETTAGLLVDPGAQSQPSAAAEPTEPVPTSVNRELAESLVMDFYEALPRQKPHAYSLLGPQMQGDGQESFESSWLRASDVNPNILASEGDSVRASITVSRFTDPEVTRLIVRLDVRPIMVDGAPQLRIVGAQLLSAHRS